jgi:hypothetical protein
MREMLLRENVLTYEYPWQYSCVIQVKATQSVVRLGVLSELFKKF